MGQQKKAGRDATEKVFLVCWWEPEVTNIESVHRTYKGALLSWDNVRRRVLAQVREELKLSDDSHWTSNVRRRIKSLSCTDPDKMDNYAYETPYIREMVLCD